LRTTEELPDDDDDADDYDDDDAMRHRKHVGIVRYN